MPKKGHGKYCLCTGCTNDARERNEHAARRETERNARSSRGKSSKSGWQPPEADAVKATFNPRTETTANYYGGEEKADGLGHGHAEVDAQGNITYNREPGEKY